VGVFVPGPREVTEALWNACCAAAAATGLTGAGHQSDRCSTGSKLQVSAVRVGVFWLERLFVGS
jgi:hypothetical protein